MKTQYLIIAIFLLSFSVLMAQENEEKLNTKTQKIAASQVQQSVDNSVAAKAPSSTGGTNSVTAVTSYDFTTGSGQYFGGAAGAKDLSAAQDGSGPWGMIAGETNNSGVVTHSDKIIIDANINVTGYLVGDVNFSGVITHADKILIDANINRATQVSN